VIVQGKRRVALHVELLETREAPSASPWLSETFDTTAVGSLPAGWAGWNNSGGGAFQVSTAHALSGSNGLTSNATASAADARAWYTTVTPADVDASADVYLNSLIPTRVLVRGSGLSTATPSFYAVAVTRGLQVQLLRVVNGVTTVLASLNSQSYFSNNWVQVTVEINGSTLQAQLYRPDLKQYLGSSGQWTATATWALGTTDTTITQAGLAGVERPGSYVGAVSLDNFTVTSLDSPPPTPSVSETFDTTPVGTLPAGWAGWTNSSSGAFQVSTLHALSGSNGLTSNAAASSAAARAWYATAMPAGVQASAAFYVNNTQPVQILVRGSGLSTTTPTYYAVSITRGLQVQLLAVVNGVTTVLAGLSTPSYFSNNWATVTLYANGNNLRVQVYRPDQGLYLNSSGQWVATAGTWAINLTDTTITQAGFVGVARPAQYIGAVSLDNFTAVAAGGDNQPPTVAITNPAANATVGGVITVQATATDPTSITKVEFYVDGVLRQAVTTAPYTWAFDTTTTANGTHTLTVKAYDPAGNVGQASVTITTQNNNALSVPSIAQHLPGIGIAELAYTGTPLDAATLAVLANVDLVVADPSLLAQIAAASPSTERLIYTNFSNVYGTELLDWLAYADTNGISRESAFYHVTQATPFSGSSGSSIPVSWFWDVETPSGSNWTNLTSQANGTTPGGVALASAGNALYIGYPELFREIDVKLAAAAGAGWSAAIQYPTAVNAAGTPTAWGTITPLTDTTAGWTQSGQITFDPPPDWVPAVVEPGGQRLDYVRILTLTPGTAPVANTILGVDYVNAAGGTSGVIPAFDYAAAGAKDYLTAAEYAKRAPGDNAWFAYQSRVFYPNYGQMRFATDPSNLAFDNWAVSYARRVLQGQPLAQGFFVDNSGGNPPVTQGSVLETAAAYATDYAAMLNKIAQAVGPDWLLANTAGGGSVGAAVVAQVQGWYDEFGIRALSSTAAQFEDLAGMLVQYEASRSPAPVGVLDSYPTPGFALTDPRLDLATLAEYYLLAQPGSTYLDFFGGAQPSSSWANHWVPAAAYNIGQPTGSWSVFATGADPSDAALTYTVFERQYTNALVLYKPLSAGGGQTGTTADNTATTFQLGGSYQLLNADGSLGPVVTSVTLRNGEGAILVRASS
jgi:hypothetical protein